MFLASDRQIAASCFNLHDLEAVARRRLPRGLMEFINRGVEDEVTMAANRAPLKHIALRQRVGVDVSGRSTAISLFGQHQALPIALAITGFSGMIRYRGEELLAEAAAEVGVPFTIGTMNFTAVERIREICGDHTWYQIYPAKRREISDHQVARAQAAGVKTLMVTLDMAAPANREYLKRSGFGVPITPTAATVADVLCHPRWLLGTYARYWRAGMPRLANMPDGQGELFHKGADLSGVAVADDMTWADIGHLRRTWRGNLIVKGLATAEDARLAAAAGVDGIVVSNHGGRSLDGCVAAIRALPEVVDAVGSQVAVMVDGGFLRGADVLKALALGARAVLIGRGTLFGLAAAGKPGVDRALHLLREETHNALGLLGCTTIGELGSGHVLLPAGW